MSTQRKRPTRSKYASKFDEVATLYNQAPRLTLRQIARRTGIPRSSMSYVHKLMVDHGLIEERKGKGGYALTAKQLNRIQAMHRMRVKEGKTLVEIARRFGLSPQAVQQNLDRHGVGRADQHKWKDELLCLYNAGTTDRAELSKRLGKNMHTVRIAISDLLQEGKIEYKKQPRPVDPAIMLKVKKIDEMRKRGVPWNEIAAKFGVNHYPALHRLYTKHKDKLKSLAPKS